MTSIHMGPEDIFCSTKISKGKESLSKNKNCKDAAVRNTLCTETSDEIHPVTEEKAAF